MRIVPKKVRKSCCLYKPWSPQNECSRDETKVVPVATVDPDMVLNLSADKLRDVENRLNNLGCFGDEDDEEYRENWKSKARNDNVDEDICVSDDSGVESATSSWERPATMEVKERTLVKLEEELRKTREMLKTRDAEVVKLTKVRESLESEMEDLTASLFQEAHSMVREANMRQLAAEKSLKESLMKVDMLTAEVSALKTLVLTSTPSQPNLHLHSQISRTKPKENINSIPPNKVKKHVRSSSHDELDYYSEDKGILCAENRNYQDDNIEMNNYLEVDPNVHKEFVQWKENPVLTKDSYFIRRIYEEDIDSCLKFSNELLSAEVKAAIEKEDIYVEMMDRSKSHFPKKCALMEVPRMCYYRMKIGSSDTWYCISRICRNRIIAVCNFLNYLRYIQRGLVKSSEQDVYWEIVRLRKEMTYAKLGLPASAESL